MHRADVVLALATALARIPRPERPAAEQRIVQELGADMQPLIEEARDLVDLQEHPPTATHRRAWRDLQARKGLPPRAAL